MHNYIGRQNNILVSSLEQSYIYTSALGNSRAALSARLTARLTQPGSAIRQADRQADTASV